jgi:hypothetical protein
MPYKGLDYFHSEDAPLFCEREAEAAECATILGHFETRILLLHGRSGIGKSSFLRAGLVPALEARTGFCFLRADPQSLSPTFIRCTHDPIGRIRKTIEEALVSDGDMHGLKEHNRKKAKAALTAISSESDTELADAILGVLELLSGDLKDTLVLIVDQAEEVITLQPGQEGRGYREAFFYFLEELCLRELDVRIIVTLRTEYYGQFGDSFRVNPTSKLAPIRAGLEPFMLRGIREEASIKNAILRPTLTMPIPGYDRTARQKYNFQYARGVAEQIALDIKEHCAESSTLPVLQIVCKNLYENLSQRSTILMDDYLRLGRVKGTLEAFIDSAITGVLQEVECPSDQELIDRWRRVLATLVGRQEGGSVTTLIKKESILVGVAHAKGLTHEVEKTLALFASEKWGLLRSITVLDGLNQREQVREYSLGHDALALALCQWDEAYEKVEAERRSAAEAQKKLHEEQQRLHKEQRRLRKQKEIRFLWASALAMALLFFVVWNAYRDRAEDISRFTKYSDTVSTSDFRLRLLLLVAALQRADGVWSYVFPREPIERQLRDVLVRSPVFGDNDLQASGLDENGTKLALLKNGRVSIRDLESRTPEMAPFSLPSGTAATWTTSLGFVKGMKYPVLVHDGVLYFEGADKESSKKVADLLPDKLKDQQFFPDVAAGEVRVQIWNSNEGRTDVAILATENDASFMKASAFAKLNWTTGALRLVPTLSDVSNYYASIDLDETGERELTLRSLLDQNLKKVLGQLTNGPSAPRISPRTEFVRSLAFSAGGSAVASRVAGDEVQVFPFDEESLRDAAQPQKRVRLRIPPGDMQEMVSPRWPQLRPLLAGTKVGENWRVAWLTQGGAAVLEGPAGEGAVGRRLLGDKPLLTGVDNASRLNFSKDGHFLTVQQRTGGRTQVRIFDLTNRRAESIPKSGRELRDLACDTAEFQGSRQLNSLEMTIWLGGQGRQPCG